jgi:hypothetical protein
VFVGGRRSYPPPDEAQRNAWGDWQVDSAALPGARMGRAAAEDLLLAAIHRARRGILAAHRATTLTWISPVRPDLDLTHTVRLHSARLTAQGKVARLAHRLDLDRGTAETAVTLALSRRYGTEEVLDTTPDAAPAPPATLPAPPAAGAAPRMVRDTQLGGRLDSPPYRPEREGYSGNYQVVERYDPSAAWYAAAADGATERGAPLYPVRFTVDLPEIEPALREPASAEAALEYLVAVPDDLLVTP